MGTTSERQHQGNTLGKQVTKMSLFGLHSHLDGKKWIESDTKPCADKKEMAGGTYRPYGVINITNHPDHIKMFLSSERGDPRTGYLFGAHSNPMKDVGHAWFAFDKGDIIIGMAIEDDWVKILPSYLEGLEQPKEEKAHPMLQREETIDMGIYGDVVHSEWDSKGKPPRAKKQLGYHKYNIDGAQPTDKEDEFKILITSDPEFVQSTALIKRCKINPFRQITKGFMKVVEEDGEPVIKGVMVEGDWIEMYH